MPDESSIVQFVDYSKEAAAKEYVESGADFFKFADGRNKLRILPPLASWGMKTPYLKVAKHWVPKPGGKREEGQGFYCAREMAGQPCAICAFIDKLNGTGVDVDVKRAKELKAKTRYLANVLSRLNPEAGPKPVELPYTVHKDLADLRADPEFGVNYTHPTEGYDVVIVKMGSGRDTEYKVKLGEQCPLGPPDRINEWLQSQVPPNRFVQFSSREDQVAAIEGTADAFPPREEREVQGERVAAAGGGTVKNPSDVKFD